MAAFAALSAWWAAAEVGGQYVDVSVQDAVLSQSVRSRCSGWATVRWSTAAPAVSATAECSKREAAIVELLTLEDRQWNALVESARSSRVGAG